MRRTKKKSQSPNAKPRKPARPPRTAGRTAGRAAPKMPLSGSEETYTNAVFGSPRGIRNNNCYAWAIGHYDNSGGVKLQPGDLAGVTGDMSLKTCTDLKKRALSDSLAPGQKAMYTVSPGKACRRGFYKVMAFLDRNTDYHWYRQHKDVMYKLQQGNSLTSIATKLGVPPTKIKPVGNGKVLVRNADVFSHKRGFATGPILEDACGKPIFDPRKACRDYGNYNYNNFCGAYCVQASHPDTKHIKWNARTNKRAAA